MSDLTERLRGQRLATRDKPYVSATHVAALLGVPRERVVDDIKRGIAGEVAALTGAMVESWWVVEAWDVTGERLEMHRSRLTDSADEVPK